ncbi:MAG: enoyl-CoA hydratase/isomerase family protein, partial [Verrucomicrobia bacterium]|nr:enoyl-CoA hydratase/isomerase family protein [Verrucomicrobiota bacterium]
MNIQREDLGDGWVGLLFDRPNSSANLFDEPTFAELNDHLASLEKAPPKTLVIRSAKPKIFIAGADLNSFTRNPSPENLSRLIRLGQNTFDRLAALPFPTVAAVHGAALGGGCEITLACDYRVASLDKATKIGLPETMLGILPAWGGCTRLPRLIGLPGALEMIMTGRQYNSKQALKLGLIDEVAYPERLLVAAKQVVDEKSGKKRSISRQWLHFSPIASGIAAQARKKALAKTRGHYPAPLKALEVAVAGLSASHGQSLENERREFVALGQTPTAQNLIRVFFLQERAKKLSVESPTPAPKIDRVLVVGAGVMGSGISQWLSSRGLSVLMQDIGPEPLAKGMTAIAKLNQDAVRRRLLTESEANAVADRIVPVFGQVHYRQIDLLLEAAVEKLDLKQELFKA